MISRRIAHCRTRGNARKEDADGPAAAVQELVRTRDQLRTVIDSLPAMIAHWDAELRNTMANKAYVDWFGLTPEQMRGRHIREVLGETLFALNEPYALGALEGKPQLFDRSIVDTQGILRHTQASYLPDIADGRVRGFFVLVTEITERKLAEDALADETERVRTILDAVSDAVISLDTALIVVDVNASAAEMTGIRHDEACGRRLDELIRIERDDEEVGVLSLCREVMVTGASARRSGTDVLVDRLGVHTPVDWMVASLRAATGTVRGVVVTIRNVAAVRQALDESHQRALSDPLTGMKNRNYLRQLERRTEHPDAPVIIVFLDLDGFKAVNDTAGHRAGDAVLGQVAEVMRQAVRDSDEVVRVGGDEFVLLLRSCTLGDARQVAQKIVDEIEHRTFDWRESQFRVGVSAGVAVAVRETPAAVEEAIERADEACYRAKRGGGRQVAVDELASDALSAPPTA